MRCIQAQLNSLTWDTLQSWYKNCKGSLLGVRCQWGRTIYPLRGKTKFTSVHGYVVKMILNSSCKNDIKELLWPNSIKPNEENGEQTLARCQVILHLEQAHGKCHKAMSGSHITVIKHHAILISVSSGNMAFSHVLEHLFLCQVA